MGQWINQNIKPLKKHPYSDLIDAYINSVPYTPGPLYETVQQKYTYEAETEKEGYDVVAVYRYNQQTILDMYNAGYTSQKAHYIKELTGLTKTRNGIDLSIRNDIQSGGNYVFFYKATTIIGTETKEGVRTKTIEIERGGGMLTETVEPEIIDAYSRLDDHYQNLYDAIRRNILYNDENFPTVYGYYMAFLVSGGHSIWVPSGWKINAYKTLAQPEHMAKTYVLIYYEGWQTVDISNIPFISGPIRSINQAWLYRYPILPHLAYVNVSNPEFVEKLDWVASFYLPHRVEQAGTRVGGYMMFQWEQYALDKMGVQYGGNYSS